MLAIETAPASTQALTTASQLLLAVGEPGQDRRDQHAARDAGLVQARERLDAAPGRGRAGLADAPDLLVECADREVDAHVGALGGGREQVEIAQDHGRLREDRERVAGAAERLDDAAREPVAALALLVGVGVRAHGDVLAAPARARELGGEALDGVDLDDDAPLEVVAPVEPEVLVRRAGEAVRAGMAAAAIRIDRVAERHARGPRHLADDRARAHVQVLDLAQLAGGIDVVVEQRALRLGAGERPAQRVIGGRHARSIANVCSYGKRQPRSGMWRWNHPTTRVEQSITAGSDSTPWPSPG